MYTINFTIHPIWVTLTLGVLIALIVTAFAGIPTRNPVHRIMLLPNPWERLAIFGLVAAVVIGPSLLIGHGLEYMLDCNGWLRSLIQGLDTFVLLYCLYCVVHRYDELANDLHYTLERVERNETEIQHHRRTITVLEDSVHDAQLDKRIAEENFEDLLKATEREKCLREELKEPVTVNQSNASRKLIRSKETQE